MRLSQIAFGVVALATLLVGCTDSSSTPDRLLVRREVSELSQAEIDRFVSAVKTMKTIPSAYRPELNAYDYFVELHMRAFGEGGMMHGVHMGPNFLTWHRELLHRFEEELRRASGDPTITLPYWDWTNTASRNRLFQANFMGGNGDPTDENVVKTGPFREGEWEIEFHDPTDGEFGDDVDPVTSRGLTREIGENGIRYLPTRMQVQNAMAVPNYDTPPYNPSSDISQSFRNYVEGWWPNGSKMHNQVHVWVGGAMATSASPNDPIFFLHHCNVDRIWASWQAKHGNSTVPDAVTTGHLWEFGEITGGAMFDLSSMGVRYSHLEP